MWSKIFRRIVSALFIVSILSFAAITHAEIYTGEGSYVMSEGENLGVAKERAQADAMQNAAEKAGVYVKSYARSKNFELEEMIIETMTANILKLIDSPNFFQPETVDNLEGILIHVVVKVEINDSDITRWLNKNEQEKSTLVSQMEALRKANEEQAKQIAELKRQLAQSTTKEEKERITNEFAAEDKIFLSNQKVAEGWKLWEQKNFDGAKNIFNEAVQLNPHNAGAYFGRGTAYEDLQQHERAIQDLDKAIQLNPCVHSNTYNNRGWVYYKLGQYDKSLADYEKAIELDPNNFWAYNNRGVVYMEGLKEYEQAIQNYNKAIQINPHFDWAYYNLGLAYKNLKQYERAIQNYSKAIQVNPNYADAYNNRGIAYDDLGQYERAIQDYDKAIQFNSNDFFAYNNRGWAYYCLKKYQQAIKDFDKVIELNPNNTVAKNNRELCLKALGK